MQTRLRTRRLELGLTVGQLARETDVKKSLISLIETQQRTSCSLGTAVKLAPGYRWPLDRVVNAILGRGDVVDQEWVIAAVDLGDVARGSALPVLGREGQPRVQYLPLAQRFSREQALDQLREFRDIVAVRIPDGRPYLWADDLQSLEQLSPEADS